MCEQEHKKVMCVVQQSSGRVDAEPIAHQSVDSWPKDYGYAFDSPVVLPLSLGYWRIVMEVAMYLDVYRMVVQQLEAVVLQNYWQ